MAVCLSNALTIVYYKHFVVKVRLILNLAITKKIDIATFLAQS